MTVAEVRQMSGEEYLGWSVYLARKQQRRELAEKSARRG
jgi:hypothetical protein